MQKLPPFLNNRKVIMNNQNVGDIITGILNTHEQYKSQYDKIAPFFLGKDCEETAYNIWLFLKNNVPYYIESDSKQTLRSPSSIISLPADCKSYALFSNGVLDSLRRKGLINCKLAFRFAGYDVLSNNLEHVFSVINSNTNNEIWVDAVLPNFNQKKKPSFYKDKNIVMSLIALSGIGEDTTTTDTTSTDGVSAKQAADIITEISKLFSNKPSPSDWVGWDAMDSSLNQWKGSAVRSWVLNDGDSVENEALNIVSYIKSKGLEILTNTGHPVTIMGQGWRDVTIDEIVNKLSRGGYSSEAAAIKSAYYAAPSATASRTANMNIWITLALAGGAIYAISKMKK